MREKKMFAESYRSPLLSAGRLIQPTSRIAIYHLIGYNMVLWPRALDYAS